MGIVGLVYGYSKNPYTPRGATCIQEDNCNCRGLSKEQGFWAPIRFHGPGILHQEDVPPECSALEFRELPFGRPKGLWEIETPLFKGTHKILHTLVPKAEAIVWNDPASTYLLSLESLSEAGCKCSSSWEHRPWRQSFGGARSIMRMLAMELLPLAY